MKITFLLLLAFYGSFASAARWCTTDACFVSSNVPVAASCIYECSSYPVASIPLGGAELRRTCNVSGSSYAFCADATGVVNETGGSATTGATTTATTSAASTTTTTGLSTASTAEATAANYVSAGLSGFATQADYEEARARLLNEAEASNNAARTRSFIQDTVNTEVPWDRIFLGKRSTAATTTTPAVCTDIFTKRVRRGDESADVLKVQQFLNADTVTRLAESGAQSKGQETKFFNAKMLAAIKKFQQKYFDDILKAAQESAPTGIWGPFTRKKANALICNGTITLP